MIWYLLSLMQSVVHLFYRKVSRNSHYIKQKVLPPNIVSIFLFLLTNGAANQTGKSEKDIEENKFPLNCKYISKNIEVSCPLELMSFMNINCKSNQNEHVKHIFFKLPFHSRYFVIASHLLQYMWSMSVTNVLIIMNEQTALPSIDSYGIFCQR